MWQTSIQNEVCWLRVSTFHKQTLLMENMDVPLTNYAFSCPLYPFAFLIAFVLHSVIIAGCMAAQSPEHTVCSIYACDVILPQCAVCHAAHVRKRSNRPFSSVSFMCLPCLPVLYFNSSQAHKRALMCTSINQQLNGESYVPNHFLLSCAFIPVVLGVFGPGLPRNKNRLSEVS